MCANAQRDDRPAVAHYDVMPTETKCRSKSTHGKQAVGVE